MPTRAEVTTYARAQNAVVLAARQRLTRLWSSLDVWDVDAVRTALETVFPSLVADYGDAAATLAAEWFESQIGVEAVLAPTVPANAANASMRWSLGSILKGDPPQALADLAGVVDRMVKQPARDTIARSSLKAKIGWARVPSGAHTCAFCLLTASRGGVYTSREAAGGMGHSYHADCDCQTVPIRSSADYPSGYDPSKLDAMYTRAAQSGDSVNRILARMREQQGIS